MTLPYKDGRAEKFYQHLPRHRRNRRPRGMRKQHGSQFLDELAIKHRPKVIADRAEFGHWECDLVSIPWSNPAARAPEATTRVVFLSVVAE